MVLQAEERSAAMRPIRAEKDWTPSLRLKAGRIRGPRMQLPGSYVLDRADLKKALMLCASCLPKFDAVRAGYVTKKNLPLVRGRCDGCQQHAERGNLLVHHSLANLC